MTESADRTAVAAANTTDAADSNAVDDSSTAEDSSTADTTATDSTDPALPAPERRGRLTVDQSVVRKVAEHTADLAPGTVRTTRRVAGLGVGERGASAKVRGSSNQVELSLDLALEYPSAVRTVVADIRKRIVDEVSKTTGYHVRSVDVTISALLPDTRPRVL